MITNTHARTLNAHARDIFRQLGGREKISPSKLNNFETATVHKVAHIPSVK